MPLVRVELPTGKPAEYRAAVGEAIQQAMHAALKVPPEERFHIFTEHAPADLRRTCEHDVWSSQVRRR